MMLNNKDKKGVVAMIVKGIGSPSESMEPKEQNENGDEVENIGLESAAEEILSAIEAKDKAALAESLSSFIEMCFEEFEKEPHEEYGHSEEQEEE